MYCTMDIHLIVIIIIMIVSGAFGGYLNFLHNFDTVDKDMNDNLARTKYILLGIGAAFLVPAFLKMISSNLISGSDNNDYLIFGGFCLVAAIFSRRFITTIGERILEAAKKAEKSALENKQKLETTQLELTSTIERIEDVKLAVDIKNTEITEVLAIENIDNTQRNRLIDLANSYIEKTSVSDYSERLKLKAELGRHMGEIILRNNLSKEGLLEENKSEGMLLAISYSIQLRPEKEGLEILKKVAKLANQLYTKYSILVSYDTLARNSFIDKNEVPEIYNTIKPFHNRADNQLLKKMSDTINILNIINPDTKE